MRCRGAARRTSRALRLDEPRGASRVAGPKATVEEDGSQRAHYRKMNTCLRLYSMDVNRREQFGHAIHRTQASPMALPAPCAPSL